MYQIQNLRETSPIDIIPEDFFTKDGDDCILRTGRLLGNMKTKSILFVALTFFLLSCLSALSASAHVGTSTEHCSAGWQQDFDRKNALRQIRHCLEVHGWDLNSTKGTVTFEGQARKVTALHTATGLYAVEAVRYLISRGANINLKNLYEMTPLHIAAVEGYSLLCKILVKEGAKDTDQDIFGDTPLDHAVRNARSSIGHYKCAVALDPENYKLFKYEIE